MNWLTSLFSSKEQKENLISVEKDPLKEIKEEDFIDNSNPIEEDKVSISYGTMMPIDIIYQYLKEDYETKGYEDALCNPDNSYKEMNKTIIRNNLEIKMQQVKLKYKNDISDIAFHISSRQQAGLIDIVEQLRTRKLILEEHLEIIEGMEGDLERNNGYMIGMLLSYERGFLRGLAALSLETIKTNRL
jgi:hypothetical protein